MNKRRQAHPPSRGAADFYKRARHSTLAEENTLFSFLKEWIRTAAFYRTWEQILKYFRRFRVVSTAFRLFPWILLLISTHTILYAVAASAVVLLPLFVISLISFFASTSIRYKKANQAMRHYLQNQTVYVLFPERAREFSSGTFWRYNVMDLAMRENTSVVIVSPFLFSSRGMFHKSFYFNLRMEQTRIFLVRHHYFFSLKKHVLLTCTRRSIFLY